ncbi:MAG: glycosyltransferase, partial [Promethearchaeota archaeon]
LIMGLVGYFKRVSQTPSLPKGNEPLVTIQIPTFNELAALNCARCCLQFDYPQDKLQILIGDDSNNVEIKKKIDELAIQYPHIIQVTRRGSNSGFKPGNLNYMLKYSKGDLIAVFDSDFLPKPDYLRKMLFPLINDPSLTLTQARWKLRNMDQNFFSVIGGTVSLFSHYAALPFLKAIGGNSFVGGSGYIIRKKAIKEIGGWLEGSLTEDVESSLEFMIRGKKLLFLEDVIIECEAPHSLKDLCKQQMRWAFGNVMAVKRNFRNIWKSEDTIFADKIGATIFATGYVYPVLLVLLSLFGILQFIFPNPFQPQLTLLEMVGSLTLGIVLTSGSLISSAVVLFNTKQWKLIPKFILGTVLFGLWGLVYVNIGIFRALFNKKMDWFLLSKNGNNIPEILE